jgi:hypothetical protein
VARLVVGFRDVPGCAVGVGVGDSFVGVAGAAVCGFRFAEVLDRFASRSSLSRATIPLPRVALVSALVAETAAAGDGLEVDFLVD